MNEEIVFSPAAQYNLALVILRSKNNDFNRKAFSLVKKLAHGEYTNVQTNARFLLGECYENGYGIQKNYQRAIRWYQNAACNISNDLINNPDPVGERASKMLEEKIKDMDFDEELDEILFGKMIYEDLDSIEEAAEDGNIVAQKDLMNLYYLGTKNIPCDKEKALYWAKKAAENGDVYDMEHLGQAYYYGVDVKKNIRKGLYWLEKAAESGAEFSPKLLGDYCQAHKCYKDAAAWYRIFAKRKIEWRNKRLGWK